MYLLSPVITTGRECSDAIFHDKFSLPNSRQQFYTAPPGEWITCLFLFNFVQDLSIVQNKVCTLKLRDVTPIYVPVVERPCRIVGMSMEIKKEQCYTIQFCVRLDKISDRKIKNFFIDIYRYFSENIDIAIVLFITDTP